MGRAAKIAGFTLLELIVALAVLALAAAVVTPAVGRGTDSLKARAEVAGFAATLRHAREKAITSQRPHRVAVDPEAQQLVIEAQQTSDEEKATRETRRLSSRLAVDVARGAEVTFDARGMASGGHFKVTAAGAVYHVTVDRLTGRVRTTRE
jgi:general secretion pathway protein H